METGYHLRFLAGQQAARSIEGADIVRLPSQHSDTDSFGVQLYDRPTPPPVDDLVVRLTREAEESETDFVKRAFREAAARHPRLS